MKEISHKEYMASEGKVIVSKLSKAKYKHIILSSNDSIDNYEEVEDNTSTNEPSKTETVKRWNRKND